MNAQELAKLRRKIINEVIDIEGGYVNDPKDSGGATKCGITQAVARQHGFPDVRKLSKEQIYQIYESDYWDGIAGDSLAKRSPGLAYELFDSGVNVGTGRAAEFLQRALNVLNLNGQLFDDLKLDRDIGQKTLAALDAFIQRRSKAGLRTLIKTLDGLQAAFYVELSERRSKDERFTYGWLSNRVGNELQVDEKPVVKALLPSSDIEKQENTMNTQLSAPVYQMPPDGYVTDSSGEQIPYWNNQVEAFEKSPDEGFAAWLKEQAALLRKSRSKSGWKSKIMWGSGGLIATGISVATARFGFDVDPDVLLGVAAVVMTGGGSFIGAARMWFTNKFLS